MRVGLILYRVLWIVLAPLAGAILRYRASKGKENPGRFNERFAKRLPARPEGPLIWFHAASVGESLVQLEMAKRVVEQGLTQNILFTCQTLTGADTITAGIDASKSLSNIWARQQMAPIDSPQVASRFVSHWKPDLAVFAEGDVWPNLLKNLRAQSIPAALINARMTEKSISGWRRWPKTAHHVFNHFTEILASDRKTATGLSKLTGRDIVCSGNLKSALPLPRPNASEQTSLQALIGQRPILLAASTHAGEEALFLDALLQIQPRPFAIIAPRHPERADEIIRLLSCSNLSWVRRSANEMPDQETDILLADTIGEMGLWYRLADFVYLGGGHAPGVGGHNPLEPIRIGRPVVTGPSVFNFEDMIAELKQDGAIRIVADALELRAAYPASPPPQSLLDQLQVSALGPIKTTLKALEPLLTKKASA